MTGNPDDPNQQDDGATRVDLGDDLVEKTAMLVVPGERAPAAPIVPVGSEETAPLESVGADVPEEPERPRMFERDEIQDQLESARILINEGIVEEAKKLLRRILLSAAGDVQARHMLEEIHQIELKQLFGEERARRSLREKAPTGPELHNVNAEEVMRELDHDLRLGIFSGREADPIAAELSLFQDRATLEAFAAKLDRELGRQPVAERIDIGVAFLEMGLFELAARQFRTALHRVEEDFEAKLSASALLAYALILGNRPFDATIELQPLLRDSEVKRDRKIELFYLMARATEALDKKPEAIAWYDQTLELDAKYRDSRDRVRKLRPLPPRKR